MLDTFEYISIILHFRKDIRSLYDSTRDELIRINNEKLIRDQINLADKTLIATRLAVIIALIALFIAFFI